MKLSNCIGCEYLCVRDGGKYLCCFRLKDKPRTKGEYELTEDCYIMRRGWDCFVMLDEVTVCSLSNHVTENKSIFDW